MDSLIFIYLGIGIIVFGAAYGISKIGAAGMEAMGRQPDIADKISSSQFVPMVLIEGATLFGLLVCFLVARS
ncbi:MAG: ATP synthase F0 subunit C [Bacteroidota bacterium]